MNLDVPLVQRASGRRCGHGHRPGSIDHGLTVPDLLEELNAAWRIAEEPPLTSALIIAAVGFAQEVEHHRDAPARSSRRKGVARRRGFHAWNCELVPREIGWSVSTSSRSGESEARRVSN